jgi:hypothetical protein
LGCIYDCQRAQVAGILTQPKFAKFMGVPVVNTGSGAFPVRRKIDDAFFGRDSANIDQCIVKKSNIRD